MSREEMIEWCSLITGYHSVYFQKLSDTELKEMYDKNMEKVTQEVTESINK